VPREEQGARATASAARTVRHDHIIVGGGSAGCVLAGRLTEDPNRRVLLIEAGRDYPPGREPADVRDTYYLTFFRPDNFWPHLRAYFAPLPHNQPEAAVARRYEQGRIMGGGSSINAMIALRGMQGDFEEWVAAGAGNWGWDDVLPYYRKLERDLDFDGPLHGAEGPIPVRRHRRDQWPGFCREVVRAVEELHGFEHVEDMNAEVRNGYGSVPISSLPEQRVSAAMGYLDDAVRSRENLDIMAETEVDGLLFEGTRVVGVRTVRNGAGAEHRGGEVIVAAGTLQSPALLIRSGIGPASDIKDLGLEVRAELPGVGANLQDHPAVSMAAYLKPAGKQPRGLRAAPNVALRYSSGVEGCPGSDMYISVTNKSSWHPLGQQLGGLVCCVYKPFSRGRVSVAKLDRRVSPRIEFNLLADDRDVERLAGSLKMADAIYRHPALAGVVYEVFPASYSERMRDLNRYGAANWLRSLAGNALLNGPAGLRRYLIRKVIAPGDDAETLLADDRALKQWVRDRAVPFYHPVGTCRMGAKDDKQAVVDRDCRVGGVSNLRVIDASVMPTIPRANTNLTVMMIAEKMADAIKAGR
jgi:5-(hydroxymethyl)furfural/furfural oxidase